jgi:hypothetical protein
VSHICVVHTLTEHMLADPPTKRLSPRVFQEHVTHMGLLESFVLLSEWELCVVFVCREYLFCVVMYCFARICMNYDIGVVIRDIVCESRLASYEYVVITVVLFVFYTCSLCLDHVIVSACCMFCILSMYYNFSLANTFGSDYVLKCLFAFVLYLSDLFCLRWRLFYLFILGGLA